ncbi:hypothetical protein JTE90_016523 [Oedothorax gibbosus]|uniref:Uncharacterized protein n=1 Tax=Oedothorax gibbosus TaxID=931172 RepID=A0AAV6TKF8_9ARAC|nr:hypothetical protein JTE90_016523 [Oedothorax gibbosus]
MKVQAGGGWARAFGTHLSPFGAGAPEPRRFHWGKVAGVFERKTFGGPKKRGELLPKKGRGQGETLGVESVPRGLEKSLPKRESLPKSPKKCGLSPLGPNPKGKGGLKFPNPTGDRSPLGPSGGFNPKTEPENVDGGHGAELSVSLKSSCPWNRLAGDRDAGFVKHRVSCGVRMRLCWP